jgi:FkbM family methyltransferase
MNFYSQVGQDQFLLEHFFLGKRNGVFVDVGAYDGEKFSNSLFFERSMGWTGLCVEPLPSAFAKLKSTRKAICEQVCVADFEGEADFAESDAGIDEKMLSGLARNFDSRHVQRLQQVSTGGTNRKVKVRKLSSLLAEHSLFHVDFCSIDTEGSELSILSELDLDRFHISVFTIENNYDDIRLPTLMAAKGYDFVAKLEQDYIFKRRDVKRLPRTSVFCSVWHGDPRRWDLLRGHAANLARQTVPVQPIYVFDGGDQPPSWLEGRAVLVRECLTVYQAWNVALSMAGTPLVMNLNLDDRLAPDAVDYLENVLLREGATCVGGDWNVRYSQEETDNVAECYPAARLPFVDDWPPPRGTITRLGSGTGERGTLGPATLWRIEAHLDVPRYPWRLPEGTLLKFVADTVWWRLLANQFHKKLLRLPTIIGNYHSHPGEQAEFRRSPHDEDELCLVEELGVRLV